MPPTDTSSSPSFVSRPDGRRIRGERNKEAVVEALLSLYESGDIEPSMARVAEIAGVSERSVFRYFDDKDDLIESAIARQLERVGHLYEGLSIDGSFEQRLDAIIDHRLRLFDAIQGTMRASEYLEHRSTLIRTSVDKRRAVLRAQAVDQFRPELNRLEDQQLASRVIDVALSLETISYLTRHHKRSQLRDTLVVMVRGALSQ